MTVINKVPTKPTIEAVLRLATSEVIYYAICLRVLDCRKVIVCRCLKD